MLGAIYGMYPSVCSFRLSPSILSIDEVEKQIAKNKLLLEEESRKDAGHKVDRDGIIGEQEDEDILF
jgi:hypothetical protein